MGYEEIREEIAAILASVEGVGRVHQYQRVTVNFDKFIALFRDDEGKINAWCVTRIRMGAERQVGRKVLRPHTFLIRGYLGLQDDQASEIEFQKTINRIADAFDAKNTLNGLADSAGPIQVTVVDSRIFGTVVCHFAELSFEAVERLSY